MVASSVLGSTRNSVFPFPPRLFDLADDERQISDASATTNATVPARQTGAVNRMLPKPKSMAEWVIDAFRLSILKGSRPSSESVLLTYRSDAMSSRTPLTTDNPPGEIIRQINLRLLKLGQLTDGWQGNDSIAPTNRTINDAKFLLRGLRAAGAPEPMISADADGFIHFDLRHGDFRLSLRIEGDGLFGYTIFRDGTFWPGAADGDVADDVLPDDLIEYLGSMRRQAVASRNDD